MQWWCSAQTAAWTWTWQAYPGVWGFVALLGASYWLLRRRGGLGTAADDRLRTTSFVVGLICVWVALDWPVGALGAGYLASVHMVQFLLIALIAPPLILFGIPPRLFGALEDRRALLGVLRTLTHPLLTLIVFNITVLVTHWPSIVDGLMATQVGSLLLDVAWLGAGMLLWWPVVAPVPRRPVFSYLYKIGYLILATILNTPVFAYLTFSDLPQYATFELSPPVAGIGPREDQRLAGLLMKVGGGVVLWIAITVLFFRWYRSEEAGNEEPERRKVAESEARSLAAEGSQPARDDVK